MSALEIAASRESFRAVRDAAAVLQRITDFLLTPWRQDTRRDDRTTHRVRTPSSPAFDVLRLISQRREMRLDRRLTHC